MTETRRLVFLVALVGVLLLATGIGTVAGQSTGAQDPVDSNGNRIVPDGGTLFLGEDDIALDKGVFAGVSPGEFVDPDDGVLMITNGVVDPSNAISTYTGPNGNVIEVREARVQSLFVIDALREQRLDDAGTREVEQPGGVRKDFNVQFAIDYNYVESASIDETLLQDGADVTDIYFESKQDAALSPQSSFESVDERQRTYDALFNFDIDDTGEYIFTAAPASGDDRPDDRDVGFNTREDATDTTTVTIVEDEEVGLELGSNEANQGDRTDFSITGLLFEGETATVTLEKEDFRYGGFGSGEFGELVREFSASGTTIADDNPIEFVSESFRQVDETAATGLIFRATSDFNNPGISPPGERLALETAGVDENDLVIFDTETLADVSVYRVRDDGLPVEITDSVPGPGPIDLGDRGTSDLNRFVGSVAGTPTLTLERSYGVIQRDEVDSDGQIDTEKLDDVSADIELFEGAVSPSSPDNVTQTHGNMFLNSGFFDDGDDEKTLDVEEVDLSINSPGNTYPLGTEVDLSGSITGTADDVVILTRDQGNYFHVTTATTDRAGGSYGRTDFDLSTEAVTDEAQDILGQPGSYRYGVIDAVDVDIIQALNPGTDVLGEDGLRPSDFNQGASEDQPITVDASGVPTATVESNGVTLDGTGDTAEGAITLDAEEGLSFAQLNLSVDTSVAEITSVREGADVDSADSDVSFEVVDQTAGSVRVEYSDFGADPVSVTGFELAVVEFGAQTDSGATTVEIKDEEVLDGNRDAYVAVITQEGTVSVGSGGGSLTPNNPFGDSGNNPVDRSTVIDRVVEWNLNGEINGTSYTRQEIIDFVVEWNLAS